jgi:hypothetical protein
MTTLSERTIGIGTYSTEVYDAKAEPAPWKGVEEVDKSRAWIQKGLTFTDRKHFEWDKSLQWRVGVQPCYAMGDLRGVLYLYSDGKSEFIAHWLAAHHMLPAWQERVHVVFYLMDSHDTVIERLDTGGLMNSCSNYQDTRSLRLDRPEKFDDVVQMSVSLEKGFFTPC